MSKEVFVSLQDCSFSYTKTPIIKGINITVHKNDKIALVGKNGVGKSTLMEILSMGKEPTEGEIWFSPNITIGFLKQKNFFNSKKTVFKYLLEKLNSQQTLHKSNQIMQVCKDLKINSNSDLRYLSGGMIRKIALAELLIKKPNLLFLDEPTNHLDIESIEWLENFLNKNFKGAFLVVSHDRKFLENITNKVFWMDRGTIKVSPKGFLNFNDWSQQLIDHERRRLKNKENLLRQELEWLTKGVKARRKRNEKRKESVINLKKDYNNERSQFFKSISTVNFSHHKDLELGPNVIAQLFNVSKKYRLGDQDINLIENFNYKLVRGEKIGILGKNGIGKSTLMKLFSKQIDPDSGNVKLRESIQYSYFDQKSEQINEKLSIKENLIPNGGDYLLVNSVKKHICGYLKNFLFDPSIVNDKVSTLSGGQRNRLLLAKILASPKQLLILDEPTNDLDLETLDMLKDYIISYTGTVLIASHDRDFLDNVAKKIFYFIGNGKIHISYETCSEILQRGEKNMNKDESECKKKAVKYEKNQSSKKPVNIEKKIKQIMSKIEKIEKKIIDRSKIIQDTNLYEENIEMFYQVTKEIEGFQTDLSLLEKEWKNLEEENFEI